MVGVLYVVSDPISLEVRCDKEAYGNLRRLCPPLFLRVVVCCTVQHDLAVTLRVAVRAVVVAVSRVEAVECCCRSCGVLYGAC